jgi:uncharacterized membrane protein HdeD (DUF308 family)
MNPHFSDYWWLFLVRGVFAILLGVMAIIFPATTITVLALFIGAYMFVDGLFSIVAAFNARRTMRTWAWLLASGILGVIIGIVTFINPFATVVAILSLVALWSLLIGIAEIVWAFRLRKVIRGEGWYIASGILSIAFSFLLLILPAAGILTITWLFGIYAITIGIILISLGIRLKRHHTVLGPRMGFS